MKFNCYYRGKDGSRQSVMLCANDRHDAFHQANSKGLIVIEMYESRESLPKNPIKSKKHEVVHTKLVEDNEITIYKQREHSYILGVLFGPIGFLSITCFECGFGKLT